MSSRPEPITEQQAPCHQPLSRRFPHVLSATSTFCVHRAEPLSERGEISIRCRMLICVSKGMRTEQNEAVTVCMPWTWMHALQPAARGRARFAAQHRDPHSSSRVQLQADVSVGFDDLIMATGSITPWFPLITCLAVIGYLVSNYPNGVLARTGRRLKRRLKSSVSKSELVQVCMNRGMI